MSHYDNVFDSIVFFFFNDTATTEIYTLSLHDALPISGKSYCSRRFGGATCDDKSAQIYARFDKNEQIRSEERFSRNAETDLVCRLLLEKKKNKRKERTKPVWLRCELVSTMNMNDLINS